MCTYVLISTKMLATLIEHMLVNNIVEDAFLCGQCFS